MGKKRKVVIYGFKSCNVVCTCAGTATLIIFWPLIVAALVFLSVFFIPKNYDHNIGRSRIKMSLFPDLSRSKYVAFSMDLVCS